MRQTDIGGRRRLQKSAASFGGEAIWLDDDWAIRSDFTVKTSRFVFVRQIDEIGMLHGLFGGMHQPPPGERVENPAEKSSTRAARPTPNAFGATLEAIIKPVQADRMRNQKSVKPQLFFGRRQRTNERVDHIVARAFPFHKRGRFIGKEHLA